MRFVGAAFRAHSPEWAWSPLSGDGARRTGGRFNRRGVPALYTSLAPMTAIREASPLGRPLRPITLCEYAVNAAPVFDTFDPALCGAHGVERSMLDCPDWNREMLEGRLPASQALADRLVAAGFVAMRVPSFARGAGPEDVNLVFWSWGDQPPARIEVIDPERRLPHGPASWR